MFALADNSCLGRLFRRVCEPAETREKAEEPAFFYLSPINAKNLGKSSKRSREILWEIVGQTLENRFLDGFCEVRPERIGGNRQSAWLSRLINGH